MYTKTRVLISTNGAPRLWCIQKPRFSYPPTAPQDPTIHQNVLWQRVVKNLRIYPVAQAHARIPHGLERESIVRQHFCVQRPLLHKRPDVFLAMLGHMPMLGDPPLRVDVFPPSFGRPGIRDDIRAWPLHLKRRTIYVFGVRMATLEAIPLPHTSHALQVDAIVWNSL